LSTRYYKLITAAFLILLFFTFWGTELPFQERTTDVEDIAASNIVNQVLYSFLFLVSIICLIPRAKDFSKIIMKEKFLSLFIIWALITVIWSPEPFVSFKRLFQIISISLTFTVFLTYVRNENQVLKYFKYILYPYLILSIAAVFVIPAAIDPEFLSWRGFTAHKNTLGQFGLISVVTCYVIYRSESSFYAKLFAGSMIFISIALLAGSLSSTAILTFLIVIAFGSVLMIDRVFKPLGISRAASVITTSILLLIIVLLVVWVPEIDTLIPQLFGKDSSFSGRTYLWEYIWEEVQKHPLHGTGYQGFWITDSPRITALYTFFVWLPNQSHNGYLDIMNETGMIGLLLFLLILINYLIGLFKLKVSHYWMLIPIIGIITNMQESTFMRPGQFLNTMFIFSYLLLFALWSGVISKTEE
jgi:O-antigen ligase